MKIWTIEEEKKAMDLLSEGLGYMEVAEILGRSFQSLAHKNSKDWKIKNIGGRIEWKAEEDILGSKLMVETHSFKEVAKVLGRTPSAVQRRNSCVWRVNNRSWTVEEETKCIEMIQQGKSYSEISSIIGKSIKAIEQKNITKWKLDALSHARKRMRGKGNPNYKHGRYAGDAIYRSMIGIDSCTRCGTSEGRIVRHHINFDHQDNRVTNLIPLCADCHLQVHRIGKKLLRIFVDTTLMSLVSLEKEDFGMKHDACKRELLCKLEVFLRRELEMFLLPLQQYLSEKEKNELGDVTKILTKNSRKIASRLLEGYKVYPQGEGETKKVVNE